MPSTKALPAKGHKTFNPIDSVPQTCTSKENSANPWATGSCRVLWNLPAAEMGLVPHKCLLKNSFKEGKHTQHSPVPVFLCYWFYFIYYLQEKIYLQKKETLSSELSPRLTQQLNFYAGYFFASLLFIGILFFNFPLKILICMIGLSSLKQIFLVFDFYLILSSLFILIIKQL